MNKQQRKEISFAKKIASNTMENAPLAKFRIARRYTRTVLAYNECYTQKAMKKRGDIFMNWYSNVLKNWKW